jgi:acetyl esterase/lipase
LPPTLVITNECDPLRAEAEAVAHAIGEAGVESRRERFPGLAHGAFWISPAVPRCADQPALVAEFLQACAGAEQAERSIAHDV